MPNPTLRPRPSRPGAAALAAGGVALLLSGCSDLTRAVGIDRSTPNEFTVTTQAPLVMPPDLDGPLPKPSPGAARPQTQSARLGALEAIDPDAALRGAAGSDSPGQRALVEEASAEASGPVGKGGEVAGGSGLIAGLAFWRGRSGDALVDPVAERRRLADDASDGRAPTDGVTPAHAPD